MTALPHDHTHHAHTRTDAARPPLARWTATLLLLGMAGYFAWTIASGNLAFYINARFVWLSYVAAALFALLGGWQAWSLLTQPPAHAHDHAHDATCDHTHDAQPHSHTPGLFALAVVAMPLLLGLLLPARPLGAEAVRGSISINAIAGEAVQPYTSDPLRWNVLDWLRAFDRSDNPASFNGQRADVIGFLYHEPGYPPDQFLLARFTVSCCVADAFAIGVPVAWDGLTPDAQGQWLRVTGAFALGTFHQDAVPVLQAETVEFIEQPTHPYIYP